MDNLHVITDNIVVLIVLINIIIIEPYRASLHVIINTYFCIKNINTK